MKLMRDIHESVRDQNEVGLRILERLLQTKAKDSNVVFSPLSIHMMLTLLAAGVSKGPMLDDLLSFLKFKSVDELNLFVSKLVAFIFKDESATGGPCVTSANAVWIGDDLPVKPSFQKVLEAVYKGKLNQVDFANQSNQVVKDANSWVKRETKGLISKIFSPNSINGSTRMILANTVYFKAAWASPFNDALKDYDFHLLNGGSVKVPFMAGCGDEAISYFDGFKVASLSYESEDGRHFSMSIYLPDARDGLPSLIERACSEPGFLDRYRPKHAVAVDKFKIPKFKFPFGFSATQILTDLGLSSLFSVGPGFTEMVESPAGKELFVSNMFHKAVISVDENGTEAAAVTECEMMGSCLQMDPVRMSFVADHPFLFLIRESVSRTILFVGQVLNPSLD